MPRRADHEGSIRRRGEDAWEASVQLDGRRFYVSGRTKTEVARKVHDLRVQRDAGRLVAPTPTTVAQHLDDWLRAVKPGLRPTTVADYEATIRNHLVPAFGHVRLQRLSTAAVAVQFAEWAAESRLSGKSLQNVHNTLHRALAFAVLWGRLGHNPMAGLPAPKGESKAPTVWSVEEANRFLRALPTGTWEGALFATMLATGCRIGEAMALRWPQWNEQDATMRINGTRVRLRGSFIDGPAKTAAGVREVGLPPFLAPHLTAWREAQATQRREAGAAWVGDDLIVTRLDGRTPVHRTAYDALRRLCNAAGVRPVRPHDLRHFHASMLLADGVGVPTVSKRLGHASPAVTMTIYAHALTEWDNRAAESVSRLLGGMTGEAPSER